MSFLYDAIATAAAAIWKLAAHALQALATILSEDPTEGNFNPIEEREACPFLFLYIDIGISGVKE